MSYLEISLLNYLSIYLSQAIHIYLSIYLGLFLIIHIYLSQSIYLSLFYRGVMVNMLDFDLVVNKFENQSRYKIHFNKPVKRNNFPNSQLLVK